MSAKQRIVFSELTRDESLALLERNHVGRLAFTFHDRVDMEPISYVYHAGWLYARTSPGTKLTTVQHHPWVAFEVDEVHARANWQSVVVRGTIYFLEPNRGGSAHDDYELAVDVLRQIDTDALTENDLVPHRSTVFRIHADEITGRAASPG